MYIDGFCVGVKTAKQAEYLVHAKKMAVLLKELGAVRVVEGWGANVPDGVLTSFPMAVKREADETVIFSWIEWKDKTTRDAGWEKIMADPMMQNDDYKEIFDGKRMIFGEFESILDV